MNSTPPSPLIQRGNSKSEFVQQFNSKNAKILAFFIVCGFVLYHSILRLAHGIDSCKWLLSDGNFRDQVWQPYGCMMHHYSPVDSRRCLRYNEYLGGKNYFVFLGDSRIEQLYHSFIHQISPGYEGPKRNEVTSPKSTADFFVPPQFLSRSDLSFNESQLGLTVQFFWLPFPNKTMISTLQQWKSSTDKPSVAVIASGGYPIKTSDPLDPNSLEDYTASLTHLVVNIDRLSELGSRVLWALQEPVAPEKLNDEWTPLTNEQIDFYNYHSLKVLRYSKADIWSSGKLVAHENIDETPDGYHLGPKTLFHDSQVIYKSCYISHLSGNHDVILIWVDPKKILLNMYCNDNMNYNDATCCSSSEPISSLQMFTFAFLAICVVLAIAVMVKKRFFSGKQEYTYNSLKFNGYTANNPENPTLVYDPHPLYKPILALSKLALIMAFFFLCDRTTMFMKENKYFTQTNFWLPVVYILVLGIFFTEDSAYTKVLHFDQDNETKGWMVLLILVYNMMGASQVLPIFMFVKILYSAFLFLHGWNEFISYLQRGDYSLVRFFSDLVRLNLMTVLLCLCMNRPYQFYEFIPLMSFWTFVVYVALSLPPRITWTTCEASSLNYLYLILKIVGILSFVTILYISEVFFEKVFVTRPWKALFVTTDDDIHEWWTRWKIDRYSLPCGMLLALGYHVMRKYKVLEDDNHGNLFSMRISLMAVFLSLGGIAGYSIFSFLCRNQLECIEIHSYIVALPIISYILLRNVSGMLRTRVSGFFAWFGQFWVELLVGQHHVWMGADGHGVLVLVPAYPVGNVLLTAFVFACIAHEIHKCTEVVLPYLVPEDWRKCLRNMFFFVLILVPIGIHDGMF